MNCSRLLARSLPLMLLTSLVLQACSYAPSGQADPPAAAPTMFDLQPQGNSILPTRSDLQAKACPIPPGSPGLPALEEARNWTSEISTYLNAGGLLTATVVGAPLGIPLAVFGLLLLLRGLF